MRKIPKKKKKKLLVTYPNDTSSKKEKDRTQIIKAHKNDKNIKKNTTALRDLVFKHTSREAVLQLVSLGAPNQFFRSGSQCNATISKKASNTCKFLNSCEKKCFT